MAVSGRSLLQQVKAAFFPPSGMSEEEIRRLLVHAEYAGDPTNNLTPEFVGQLCRDTANAALYWASTTASSGWKKLSP